MYPPKIHNIGAYSGTTKELAKVVGISTSNMRKRINKWEEGLYSCQKCMTIGSMSRKDLTTYGNSAWEALQD